MKRFNSVLLAVFAIFMLAGCPDEPNSDPADPINPPGPVDPVNVTPVSIEVTKLPSKTTFCANQRIHKEDIADMELTLTYSDGTTKILSYDEYSLLIDFRKTAGEGVVDVVYVSEEGMLTSSFPVEYTTQYEVTENLISKYAPLSITGGAYEEKDCVITLTEAAEYKITGYYKGQIATTEKNTTLNFKDAFIWNDNGKAAVYCAKKAVIITSTDYTVQKGPENYFITTGTSDDADDAAIYGKKDLTFKNSESSSCIISGSVKHGIKADDIKFECTEFSSDIKGMNLVRYFIYGTAKGSAINCKSFESAGMTDELGLHSLQVNLFNAKNGIKAEETVIVDQTDMMVTNVSTCFKTDTTEEDDSKEHFIKLSDSYIETAYVENFALTDEGKLTQENVTVKGIEE